ncbi:glyoxalase bleomycin resistance protein dioxygenase protein [Diplodia corticola]|uniref:Glyoxalase bleomycin resistance protein dioxygenase protein n=1 Tax=Diplodia corticola TaxID=236234 RepID=A0A1J9RK25_9PEZI|nr:glyoxalase bleomycin resistance protein dioxygenase protein [Diplodia corticola]OJD28871.1 glyoxalase bleomycin resistance protein dioxygenase protein [Diplodia corticola]
MDFSEDYKAESAADVGELWAKAVREYAKETERDITRVQHMSTKEILEEQKRALDKFKGFRHDGQVTDKFRSVVSTNSELIMSAAKQISNAASTAFPPAGTVLMAFTWIMDGSKNVSKDYDVIYTFFDIQHSFLKRISIIEKKVPDIKIYQTIMMRVFTAILDLCKIATRYQKEGRFIKWTKALIKGSDEKLQSALGSLKSNIERLESATMFATLRQTIETHQSVTETATLTRQVLSIQQEQTGILKENAMVGQQTLEISQQNSREMQKVSGIISRYFTMSDNSQEQGKGEKLRKPKDAGARRSAALAQVKEALQTVAFTATTMAYADIKQAFVEGTFKWLRENETYNAFAAGENEPFLWVTGDRGLGKSSLAYFAVNELRERRHFCQTNVAYFFFKEEHKELRSTVDLLKTVAAQLAETDHKYREEVAKEIKKSAENLGDGEASLLWDQLFASKFPHESPTRLFLVIDGFDEAGAADREKLLSLLAQVKKDNLQIRVMITSRPKTEGVESLQPASLPIAIDHLRRDLRLIIKARIKSMSRLRRLRLPVKKRVIIKLLQNADSALYAEHVLRRLNSLRREATILKELDKLPASLSDLYNLLLAECQKGRSDEDLASLKRLFAWLAYSKRPLAYGEASNLVAFVNDDAKLSLEEEIEGKSARLLRLAQITSDDDESSDESDGDGSETADEALETHDDTDPNTWVPLRFQERSLRQYFREAVVDENGLRSSPSSAHLIIFRTIATILTTDVEDDLTIKMLKNYCADFWIHHFLDIEVESAGDDEVKSVLESLSDIVNNKNRALEKIEENASGLGIFGESKDLRERMFNSIKQWVGRASDLPTDFLNTESLNLVSSLSEDPSKLMEQIARKHVFNWFNYAAYRWEAWRSFHFALEALKLTNMLVDELKNVGDEPTAEQILLVAGAFPDLERSSYAHRAIGLVMKWYNHWESALEECKKSLENPGSNLENFHALGSVSDAAKQLASEEADAEKKAEYIKQIKETVMAMIAEYSQLGPQGEEENTKIYMARSFLTLSGCALLEDDMAAAISIFNDQAKPLLPDEFLPNDVIAEIMAKLIEKGQDDRLLEFFATLKDKEKLVWLADQGTHEDFQRAAVRTGKRELIADTYERLIKMSILNWNTDFGIRFALASYYVVVDENLDKAKELLVQLLQGYQRGDNLLEEVVLDSRGLLAEVLMEQFRTTVDAVKKASILDETMRLAFPTGYVRIEDFDPALSNTALPAVLMLRKMGPLQEFQSTLNKCFDSCVAALTDNEGSNDFTSVRFFGKVLACLPGLERDAQIASASQFYYLNPEFIPKEGDSSSDDGAPAQAHPTAEDTGQNGVNGESCNERPSAENTGAPYGDLNPDTSVFCNGCGKEIYNPSEGPVYTCTTCTDTDLCTDCHHKRIGWNNGGPVTDWQAYCGKNHHYVKHPAEGWKGIKDGVIDLGEEKVEFTQWLKDVQDRWKAAWDDFWGSQEGVGDIM